MPNGFSELTIRGRLSTRVIHGLDEAMAIMRHQKGPGTAAAVSACLDGVVNKSSLSFLQRLLLITLESYCSSS